MSGIAEMATRVLEAGSDAMVDPAFEMRAGSDPHDGSR